MNTAGADTLLGQERELFRWLPRRVGPKLSTVRAEGVRAPQDLPPYLLLGRRDDASFDSGPAGWSIRWQGSEPDTWFQWRYDRCSQRNEFSQSFCGEPGGAAGAGAGSSVEAAIGGLYRRMPSNWVKAMRDRYAGPRGIFYVDLLPPGVEPLVYFPDGRFLCLLLPLPPADVSAWCERWRSRAGAEALPFPHGAAIARLRCEIVYEEARHASTPARRAALTARCTWQTAAPPLSEPERVTLADGRAGWRLDRGVLYAVLTAPFAGFPRLLQSLEDAGCLPPRGRELLGTERPDGALSVLIPVEMALAPGARLKFSPVGQAVHLALWPALAIAEGLLP